MEGQLVVGPNFIGGCRGSLLVPLVDGRRRRRRAVFRVSADVDSHHQNHYAVLGVPRSATSGDIKKAYRLLARKWHPDVTKESGADDIFKSINLAYEVLSNEVTRTQYDRVLRSRENTKQIRRNSPNGSKFEDGVRIHRWAELRHMMQQERHWKRYNTYESNSYSSGETDDEFEAETAVEDRGSFIEVLESAFLSLFLMQTVGCRLSLTFSSLMALVDKKLDAGYKLGYLIAWFLGGRGGILLTLCLSFASWACGKASSSVVSLVVVAMWVGSHLVSYVPLPRGALLALMYMSIKLQVDFN
ncbi:hypothetical protein Nepgr_020589 [Nepenthes gracilis]|uniref:J domain-containing protein n=1 Tax=Nepenthes gracilis TaxID=150966 RepID=A0AAD3XVC7_NEPGR|nr:hypothetical protein Nepgr_020589 [Nepenthes gracilis]